MGIEHQEDNCFPAFTTLKILLHYLLFWVVSDWKSFLCSPIFNIFFPLLPWRLSLTLGFSSSNVVRLGVLICFWYLCCLKIPELLDACVVDFHYFHKILSYDCSESSSSLLSDSAYPSVGPLHRASHFFCRVLLPPLCVSLDNVYEPVFKSPASFLHCAYSAD